MLRGLHAVKDLNKISGEQRAVSMVFKSNLESVEADIFCKMGMLILLINNRETHGLLSRSRSSKLVLGGEEPKEVGMGSEGLA